MYFRRVTGSSQIFPLELKSKEEKAEFPAMDAVILAAGWEGQLRFLMPNLPKIMIPINERPFLEYQLEFWKGQGVTRFIIVVGYMRQAIQDFFRDNFRGVDIVYVEEDRPLGTGGSVLNAANLIQRDRNFVLLNGDAIFKMPLSELYNLHVTNDADVTVALRELDDNDYFPGVRLAPDSHVLEFQSPDARWFENTINSGVYVVKKQMLDDTFFPPQRPLSWEDEMLPDLLGRGKRIYGRLMNGRYLDIAIPEDYERAQEMLVSP